MKKAMKKLVILMIAICLSVSSSILSLANEWKQNDKGRWWQYDNGSYPVSEWLWIDDDNDGLYECYYFNQDGYLLVNTITPDNYTVNEYGAWVVDGVVQEMADVPTYKFTDSYLQERLGSMSLSWFRPENDYDGNGVFFDLDIVRYSQEKSPQPLDEENKIMCEYFARTNAMDVIEGYAGKGTEIHVFSLCYGPEGVDYYLTCLQSELEALGHNAHLTIRFNSDSFIVFRIFVNYLD
ncbi:hypothetical protein DWX10_27255 [Clostridium sp. AF18-27]|uniref:hypothetical protein n=1 Tax=Enterocloster lavalensis TaxID=460384 RepID=UPI000E4F3CB9|nr:hypothetical protein [Enterocloster lavalensis]RHR46056.1 hypothetical protein DWX10_27255 [Clostridium sp. AF18-27]